MPRSPNTGMKHQDVSLLSKFSRKIRMFAEIELTMSRGLKTWWTSSSDDGLEMADFKRAFSENQGGDLPNSSIRISGEIMWENTHQQAEAIFKFLEDIDKFLLWWRSGFGGEQVFC